MNSTTKTTLCIIPARGGSKGIPGKNIRMVSGKPLLAWSIEQARNTPQVSRVLVSTDSAEIAAVARNYKAEIIERPPEISGDTASSESCLVHALDYVKEKENLEPDLVVFLQATSPLREADDIQKAIETMQRDNADSLFSACRGEGFVWRVEKDGTPRSFTYDHKNRPRRQDAPEDLIENGSIYIFKPWVLRQFNNRLGGKVSVYRMPALNSFQIDEPSDLELIEQLFAHRAKSQPGFQPSASDFCKIKLLVLDFDGVLTDNRVLVSEDGKEAVLCDRGDSLGIGMLKSAGIPVVVISKEKNPVVAARCRKLGIECIQGCDEKLAALQKLAESKGATPAEIAYVGNDVNDLECLQWVGAPIAVADAMPAIMSAVRFKTPRAGGHGAVRDVIDWLLNSRR
jgi:YrbI family 3-deoxy-D-manno-octulosonate 8-phosphate phosphatase